uniref:uncharacterized protein LOC122598496 n=1 Tax=Erigeron canadensis TaxID=72917 RepID=UPI001CB906EE|nr:uncharacterized protein LOC122598496 [Erigeron canadensis]
MTSIQQCSYVWIPSDINWQEPPLYDLKNKDDNSFSPNLLTFSQPLTKSKMPERSTPDFVYKRRKIQRDHSSVPPLYQSSTPTFVYGRRRRKVLGKPHHDPIVEESVKNKLPKTLENDNISSSNSNMKFQVDDVGECSSSKNISEKKPKKLIESNSENSTESDSDPILSMLRSVKPYKSKVRIDEDFQAEVPDWSDTLISDLDDYGEPVEITPVEWGLGQDLNSCKLSRLGSIGNWLQCHDVIDGDGTICGKWRRAPLFEVQTDNWGCYCAVLWDPMHADCSVPQELDTDQVIAQLEYIEVLRPRLKLKRYI